MGIFSEKDIKKISACLEPESICQEKDHHRLKIANPEGKEASY